MKAFLFFVLRVVAVGWLLATLMYWLWNPDTTDTYGFFLFFGTVFSFLLMVIYELGRIHTKRN